MTHEVITRDLPSQELISIRRTITQRELPGFVGGSLHAIYGELEALDGKPVGGPFLLYHAFGPEGIDAEACVPIGAPVAPAEPMHVRILPEAKVAATVHVGPYEDIEGTYRDLSAWILEHGYHEAGPIREHYLEGPESGLEPARYRTEIEVPIDAPTPEDGTACAC